MPDVLLAILMGVGLVATIIFFVKSMECEEFLGYLMSFVCCLITIALGVWMFYAIHLDWEVDKELNGVPIIQYDDAQVVAYPTKEDNGLYTCTNVNRKFGRQFPANQKFTIQYRKSGPYYGVYFIGANLEWIKLVPEEKSRDKDKGPVIKVPREGLSTIGIHK